jgi:hypothetical protein
MIDNAHWPDDDTGPTEETTETDAASVAPPVDGAAHAEADVRATLEERDDGPDELTMYPAGAEGFELMSTWVTAREGSYVALSKMR